MTDCITFADSWNPDRVRNRFHSHDHLSISTREFRALARRESKRLPQRGRIHAASDKRFSYLMEDADFHDWVFEWDEWDDYDDSLNDYDYPMDAYWTDFDDYDFWMDDYNCNSP